MEPAYAYANPAAQGYANSLYVKIGLVALIAAVLAGGIVYYVKPDAFLKLKNDKSSGLDMGLVAILCVGVFAVTLGVCYVVYRSSWGSSGQVPMPPAVSTQM